jgi:hypothetical protein
MQFLCHHARHAEGILWPVNCTRIRYILLR